MILLVVAAVFIATVLYLRFKSIQYGSDKENQESHSKQVENQAQPTPSAASLRTANQSEASLTAVTDTAGFSATTIQTTPSRDKTDVSFKSVATSQAGILVLSSWTHELWIKKFTGEETEKVEIRLSGPMAAKLDDRSVIIITGEQLPDSTKEHRAVRILDTLDNVVRGCAPPIADHHNGDIAVMAGRVYLVGGHTAGSGQQHICEAYDRSGNAWQQVANLNQGRTLHATAVYKDRLLVVGGLGVKFNPLETIEEYDPEKNSWSVIETSAHVQGWCRAVVIGEELWVCNNKTKTAWKYGLQTKKWTEVGPFGRDIDHVYFVFERNGRLHVIGEQKSYKLDSWKILLELQLDDAAKTVKWKQVMRVSREASLGYFCLC